MEKETNLIVSRAGEADISALCNFEIQARLTEPGVLVAEFAEERYAKFLESLQLNTSRSNAILIAADGNHVVGRCDVAILISTMDGIVTGYIDWIYVLKPNRCHGIASRLIVAAEQFFRDAGVKRFYLFTADNEEAQAFYHRNTSLSFTRREVAEKIL
ncbi:MAG: GNAT family N-acetyltransferase [Thermaerobacter sp.]|nr:GNAT family N-acetyltransferase [Thermaerobacter sp.]